MVILKAKFNSKIFACILLAHCTTFNATLGAEDAKDEKKDEGGAAASGQSGKQAEGGESGGIKYCIDSVIFHTPRTHAHTHTHTHIHNSHSHSHRCTHHMDVRTHVH